ncbi:MAG: hypothetical protein ACREIA_05675, partial [Opitutaceae bacterium]
MAPTLAFLLNRNRFDQSGLQLHLRPRRVGLSPVDEMLQVRELPQLVQRAPVVDRDRKAQLGLHFVVDAVGILIIEERIGCGQRKFGYCRPSLARGPEPDALRAAFMEDAGIKLMPFGN